MMFQSPGGRRMLKRARSLSSYQNSRRIKRFKGRQTIPRKPRDEVKIVDLPTANYSLSTTPVLTLLNGVAFGSDNFNRIGRKIVMKYLQVRGSVTKAVTTTDQDYVRVAIVYDRQSNAAAPSYADIFSSQSAAGAVTSNSESLPNEINKERFTILKDFQCDFPPAQGTGVGTFNNMEHSDTTLINWYISLKGLVVHYGAQTAVIGAINTGSLYMVCISRAGVLATPVWNLTVSTRLAFSEF